MLALVVGFLSGENPRVWQFGSANLNLTSADERTNLA
jgi:hypothetical protein